jgi:hypothetical protein
MEQSLFLALVIGVIGGGLLRRWLGGWPPFSPRGVKLAAAALLGWPLVVVLGPWGLIPAAALAASWTPGHDWTSVKALAIRYVPVPTTVAIIGLWHPWMFLYVLVGPMIVLGYSLGHRSSWNGIGGNFLDGPIALAELWAGAWVYGGLTLLFLL